MYFLPTILVLDKDSQRMICEKRPHILIAFSFVMNWSGSPCIWTQKVKKLKSVDSKANSRDHSRRIK